MPTYKDLYRLICVNVARLLLRNHHNNRMEARGRPLQAKSSLTKTLLKNLALHKKPVRRNMPQAANILLLQLQLTTQR